MRVRHWVWILALVASTAFPATAEEASSVEITYYRGHNLHRWVASSRAKQVQAQAFLDERILHEGPVDHSSYVGFLKKASAFLNEPSAKTGDSKRCRTLYTVTVRIGNQTRATSGCIAAREGALSHLVRDGEYLLRRPGGGLR